MNRELISVIEQIGREKGIDKEILFEALESALLSASRKTLGAAENLRMHIDRKSGDLRVYCRKKVVEAVADDKQEISLTAAKALNADAELDDELELEQERPPQDFGRIAARTAKGPQISLSRTHPGYLARLFQTEIPEIQEGIVLVKATAREAGERAKVAVASTKRDVDPIGACVGLRGTRIQVISRELRGEKIDIIEWSNDPASFVARALSPAKVSSVTIAEEPDPEGGAAPGETQTAALVVVPDNQLSLAIGKKGQNARLAAKLTGMRIDIKSESEVEAERAEAEHAETARAALSTLPGVTPEAFQALVETGLVSPRAVVAAGRERLAGLPAVGAAADTILAAAEAWVAEREPKDTREDEGAVAEPEHPPATAWR